MTAREREREMSCSRSYFYIGCTSYGRYEAWCVNTCGLVRLNRVRVAPFASVFPLLLLGMPSAAAISPKVPKSRRFAL